MKKDEGSFELLAVYARKHFPGRPLDTECLADAAFIEWDHWEKFQTILKNMFGG